MIWIRGIIYHMLEKICENCGNIFYKDKNRSVRDFLKRAKFCSNACKVYKQKNFYKHWEGKKRPDLIKTGAVKSMFKPGQKPWIKGKTATWQITHGLSATNFYRRWCAINQRCNNPNTKQYTDYGGRGIKIEWTSFEQFRDDMFESFQKHIDEFGKNNTQIERMDNNGNYSKQNCYWTTRANQMRNTRNNHMITYKEKTQCMTDWAKDLGISYSGLWKRLKRMTVDQALSGYEI